MKKNSFESIVQGELSKEKSFFDKLVKRYEEHGVTQDSEHLIIPSKDGRTTYILKRRKIPQDYGKSLIDIEQLIKKKLGLSGGSKAG